MRNEFVTGAHGGGSSGRQTVAAAPQPRSGDRSYRVCGLPRKARRLAYKLMGDVDVQDVAEGVFWDLDAVAVEEVWDLVGAESRWLRRSGRSRLAGLQGGAVPALHSLVDSSGWD